MSIQNEVRLLMGIQASGKSTVAQAFLDRGYVRLNRDERGGSINDLLPILEEFITSKKVVPAVIMDNTYVDPKSRAPVIALCQKYGVQINCTLMDTSLEDAQVNACIRMIRHHGRILMPEEFAKLKDPNMVPPAALYAYRKNFKKPTTAEGFGRVDIFSFVREFDKTYTNKALLLDFDGCLRNTISGEKYPVRIDDIKILPGRTEVLREFAKAGWRLLGISNQSGIAKGLLTIETARKCFEKTIEMLGVNIEIGFCPHRVPPITCYCRKPACGMGVGWIEKYKLDRTKTIVVGDMKTDQTFASRLECKFYYADDFFEAKQFAEILS